jgi:hypothetical protein
MSLSCDARIGLDRTVKQQYRIGPSRWTQPSISALYMTRVMERAMAWWQFP